MSTIEEMKVERVERVERANTETLVTDLLVAFERKYGVEVSGVELTRTYNVGERSPKLRHVTLEVKV